MEKHVSDKNIVQAKGIHTASIFRIESMKAKELQYQLTRIGAEFNQLKSMGLLTPQLMAQLFEKFSFYRDELKRRFLVREYIIENITTTLWRTNIVARAAGDLTYDGVVDYGIFGDDPTSETIADTELGNETYRKAISAAYNVANQLHLESFLTAAEVADDFEEYGFVTDATITPGTGQLTNRFTQPISKSITEGLNMQSIITYTDAT